MLNDRSLTHLAASLYFRASSSSSGGGESLAKDTHAGAAVGSPGHVFVCRAVKNTYQSHDALVGERRGIGRQAGLTVPPMDASSTPKVTGSTANLGRGKLTSTAVETDNVTESR